MSKETEELVPPPVPARTVIPDWYKESKSYFDSNNISFDSNYNIQATIKQCIPVLDALTAGYVQTSWTDLYIEDKGDDFMFVMPTHPELVRQRSVAAFQKMPIPEGYHNPTLAWERCWGIKTPPGYSTLITTPFYREDLPFRCVTGIIDSDTHHEPGAISFYIKKGFTGIIPLGTPLFQMIPFKRDDWKSIQRTFEEKKELDKGRTRVRAYFTGGYKRLYWKRKTYE